jgi:putative sterol carrier protein
VSTWLSAEWFDETRTLWSELPIGGDVSVRLQCEITGGPEGSVSCYWVFEGGRVVDSAPGVVDAPDATLTLTWDDALALHRGELNPNVAFMRGRMKVAGSMAAVIALLPAAATDAYGDVRQRILAVTGS